MKKSTWYTNPLLESRLYEVGFTFLHSSSFCLSFLASHCLVSALCWSARFKKRINLSRTSRGPVRSIALLLHVRTDVIVLSLPGFPRSELISTSHVRDEVSVFIFF